MLDYRSYTVEDFLEDVSFRNWVYELNDIDENNWNKWLLENADKKAIVERARDLLLSVKLLNESRYISVEERNREIDNLITRINRQPKAIWFDTAWYKIAASVVLIACLAIAGYFTGRHMSRKENTLSTVTIGIKHNNITHSNRTKNPLLVTLEDGSSILLQANSTISYLERSANDKREVNLSGEAFFEIAKDKNKPFYIYANGITTMVTGTSFTIRAYKNEKEVKVIVKTGKVNVYETKNPNTSESKAKANCVALLPDQQAVFKERNHNFKVTNILKVSLHEFPIQRQSFDFEQTCIRQVFNDLEKSYGVKIICEDENINSKKITANLNDRPYSNKLTLICKLIDAQYEQQDNKVIIKPNPN